MSNLKNTYGFSQSLLDAIRSVQENNKEPNEDVEQIDELSKQTLKNYTRKAVGNPKRVKGLIKATDKLYLKQYEEHESENETDHLKERMQENNSYEMHEREVEQIDELSVETALKLQKARARQGLGALITGNTKKAGYRLAQAKVANQYAKLRKAQPTGNVTGQIKIEEVELEEAQNLVPLISQLKALLSWIVSSGAIRKFAKEEADVVGMLELLEYRTKGAVGKKNRPAASKESGEGHSETGETKKQEHDEDMPDAYARASRDGRHVIPELSDAAQDKEGGTIQSSNGERPVSQKVAQLLHDHLMKMKPAERAEHSAHIFNGKVPNVKTLNHIKTARLMSQMGSEKKIGSDEGVKRGRGRPKKVQ